MYSCSPTYNVENMIPDSSLTSRYQTNANIERINVAKTATSLREIKDCTKALTIVFRPTEIIR